MNKVWYSMVWVGLMLMSAVRVSAVEVPYFDSCEYPTGDLIANYTSGVHGVPGDTTTYRGWDSVYQLDGDRLIQCLCADTGEGKQTDWWKYGEIDNEEMAWLLRQGWIYVPSGKAWGLDDLPYLARNRECVCSSGVGGSVLGLTSLAATGVNKFSRLLLASSMGILGFGISYLMWDRKWK